VPSGRANRGVDTRTLQGFFGPPVNSEHDTACGVGAGSLQEPVALRQRSRDKNRNLHPIDRNFIHCCAAVICRCVVQFYGCDRRVSSLPLERPLVGQTPQLLRLWLIQSAEKLGRAPGDGRGPFLTSIWHGCRAERAKSLNCNVTINVSCAA
jgi:hypothetical protein